MSKIKQVILVRTDIGMGPGKIASQVAHASMKVFFDKSTVHDFDLSKIPNVDVKHQMMCFLSTAERDWVLGEFTKIVLEVKNEKELILAFSKAKEMGLLCSLIEDNGHTVFNSVKTKTTVAIGPASSDDIDKITKRFRLMK